MISSRSLASLVLILASTNLAEAGSVLKNKSGLSFKESTYGVEGKLVCKRFAESYLSCVGKQSCDIKCNNGSVCGDPLPGIAKTCAINYSCDNGKSSQKILIKEGEYRIILCK